MKKTACMKMIVPSVEEAEKLLLEAENRNPGAWVTHNRIARICLLHSFPYKKVGAYNGQKDCTSEETEFVQSFLESVEYHDYDRLIQLCDAISYPEGPTYMEKRFVDVVLKRGFNELTVPKWRAFLELKTYFDEKAKEDVYSLLKIWGNP